jgi:hypothetical protein
LVSSIFLLSFSANKQQVKEGRIAKVVVAAFFPFHKLWSKAEQKNVSGCKKTKILKIF